MPARADGEDNKLEILLEKLLLVQLSQMNVPRSEMAKFLGRRKEWVAEQLTMLARGKNNE